MKVRGIYFYDLLAVLLVLALTTMDLFLAGRRLASVVCFLATLALGGGMFWLKDRFDFSRSPSAVRPAPSHRRSAAILAVILLAGGVFVVLDGLANGGVHLIIGLIGGVVFFLIALLMSAGVYFGRSEFWEEKN